MSDFNDGVDDYRGKNQMNGVAGNDASSSVVADNAGYSQNSQAYGQAYCQSAQNHDQPMQQQPQFVSPYGQSVQPQMNPQQMSQLQFAQSQMGQSYGRPVQPQMSQQQFGQPFGQQQFAQPYPYRQPYGQPVQPCMSQQPPYGQPPIGRPYGRPPYGGAPFAARAGYANGRFNSSYIERQARKFSFRWNAKEIISAIIVVVVAAIFSPVFECGFDLSFNISQIIEIIFNYHDEFYILEHVIYYMQYTFTLMIVLSFAQVLRKRFFTIAGSFVVATSVFLTLFFNSRNSRSSEWILFYLLECATIVVFFVSVEILQWLITKYKPVSNLKYMLVNFISVIIFCIAHAISTWFIFGAYVSTLRLLLDIVEFSVVAIPVLIILPCIVSLLLKAVKFSKFLNPEREMMHL